MSDNILSDKEKDLQNLDQIQKNIWKLQYKRNNAFTDEEKDECSSRIGRLELAYITLAKKYEKKYPDVHIPVDTNKEEDTEPEFAKKYEGLQYDTDDELVHRNIGLSISYNSGYDGYTEKEKEILKKLLDE